MHRCGEREPRQSQPWKRCVSALLSEAFRGRLDCLCRAETARSHSSTPLTSLQEPSPRALGGFDILLDTELQPSWRSLSLGQTLLGFFGWVSGCVWSCRLDFGIRILVPGSGTDVKIRNVSISLSPERSCSTLYAPSKAIPTERSLVFEL